MRDTPGEERTISIRTSRRDNFAELSVSDRGAGIPEDKLKEIFEPFFTSKTEGMGMGLSIARTIVDAHDGLISVRCRILIVGDGDATPAIYWFDGRRASDRARDSATLSANEVIG